VIYSAGAINPNSETTYLKVFQQLTFHAILNR
jgi:hypothetical protein